MKHLSVPYTAFVLLLGLAGAGLLVTGCSSSSQTSDASSDESATTQSAGPTLSLLYTTADETLVLHDARTDTARTLVSGAAHNGVRARSASGRYLAFSYTTADSSHLALLDLRTQTMQAVDRRPASATYSLAWHARDDRLAFAYYEPAASGVRGPGNVFVATPDGATRDVGCRAAREVLHWLPDGSLATRNDDKLYLVAPGDCATRAAADAAKIREATYDPGGDHLAYIYRELTYDSEANEYTPDSSLFLSDGRGQNAEKLFGPERRVRTLRWAPEGGELAFETRVEASGQRQIAVHDAAADRTVFLTPPDQVSADQVRPNWSPDASYVAFTRRRAETSTAAVRVEGQTRALGPVDGAVWGWLDERTVVVPGPDSLRVTSIDGQTRSTYPAPATLIYAWSQNPA